MQKTVTICDLCDKNLADGHAALELHSEWGGLLHVCTNCLVQPIHALAERVVGMKRQALATREKEQAEYRMMGGLSRAQACAPTGPPGYPR